MQRFQEVRDDPERPHGRKVPSAHAVEVPSKPSKVLPKTQKMRKEDSFPGPPLYRVRKARRIWSWGEVYAKIKNSEIPVVLRTLNATVHPSQNKPNPELVMRLK